MVTPNHLILFDGVCHLCTGSAKFVIKRDKKRKFRFASLQSNIGQKILWQSNLNSKSIDSIIYVDRGQVYIKSSAVLRILKTMGGFWGLFEVFLIIPTGIRDLVYDYVARNRYRWYGKDDECWVPTEELKEVFIE